MSHWILHVTGIDTQQSKFYDFWSGIATQLPWWSGIFLFLHHKNCSVKGCWRLGRPYCKRHQHV